MKFIQLTSFQNDSEIFINVQVIGHMYNQEEMLRGKNTGYTHICLLTNNNGGMKVKESVYEILELINN